MTKPRKYYRLSLRALLVLLTLFCLWLGKITVDARRQKATVAWIKSHGGSVLYDWRYHHDDKGQLLGAHTHAPGVPWLRNLVGDEYFQDVVGVHSLKNAGDLSPLANLHALEWVYLEGNGITDVTPLAGLKHLGSIGLQNNNIKDFTPLIGMNLSQLRVEGNPLTKSQVEQLRAAFPNTAMLWTDHWTYPDQAPRVVEQAYRSDPDR